MNEAVHRDVGGTFSCELRGGDREHVRPPTQAVREDENVRISSSCDRQGNKVVPGLLGKGDGACRPAKCLARGISCLTVKAASYPPFGAGFHTYPAIEALQLLKCACNTEITRGIGVACVHDPRFGQERHMNADGVIKVGLAPAAVMPIRRRGDGNTFPDE